MELLSQELSKKLDAKGGPIHVCAEGWTRLRPVDMLVKDPNNLLTVLTGQCKALVWDEQYFESTGRGRVRGVSVAVHDGICGVGEREFDVLAARDVILCCGALETPRLLLHSGIGLPSQIRCLSRRQRRVVPRVGEADAVEMRVGSGLRDHWTVRLRATLPARFAKGYGLCASRYVLTHKHRYKDLSVGFGKWRAMGMGGRALVSVGTATCHDTGAIKWDQERGEFLPRLTFGDRDRTLFEAQLQELRDDLQRALGIRLTDPFVPLPGRKRIMNPNWHYCGTCANAVIGNGDLRVKRVGNLRIADISTLSDIPTANTQIWAYLVAWIAVCGIQASEKEYPPPIGGRRN